MVVATLLLCVLTSAVAQQPSPTDDALGDSVWYDADSEQTVPVVVHDETKDSANRDSRWLPKAPRVRDRPTPATAAAATGLFGTGFTLGYLLGWTCALILLAGLIAAFVYAVSSTSFDGHSGSASRKKGNGDRSIDEQAMSRVKHLPAELRRTDVNMRDEAERLMISGKFDQAIILLFGHQLLMLDRAGLLRLNRSKTNGKYVRETRSSDKTIGDRLRETVDCFERSYFGRHEITPDEFRRIWTSNEAMETEVAAAEGVAA